jgi:opacity protein-like surface antigen
MKTLFAIAAVAALAASPALARTAHHPVVVPDAANAMMQGHDTPAQDGISPAVAANPNSVYVDGRYAGTDPDPNVRMQLKDDYYSYYYGN